MPETFQALAVALLLLLPGALYVWAFERFAGAWGVRFSDRVLRFVEVSAILHALAAPITYWLWVTYVRSGRLVIGDPPLVLWLFPLVGRNSSRARIPLLAPGTTPSATTGWVDPDTGEFSYGPRGAPVSRGSGILVRWSEVEYLEFIEA